jgi:hypothetical protein
MTQFDNLPEARNVGAEGSEFRLVIDHLAEFMPTLLVDLEQPTTIVTAFGDRRCMLTFVPLTDGRLTVEVRAFRDDTMQPFDVADVGTIRLLTL